MIVTPTRDARPRLGLLLIQDGQQAEDQRHARVELDAHQAVRDRLGDVLEVHGLALDEHADGDDGVEGPRGRLGLLCERRQVCRAGAEEIACAEGGGGC